MKLIPILFSTPMVQAILNGNKSMTRRTTGLDEINENPDNWQFEWADYALNKPWRFTKKSSVNEQSLKDRSFEQSAVKCPYGQPGDVLWVRETFEDYKDPECEGSTEDNCICGVRYKANNGAEPVIKWKPNIHMPFDICRIFLRVKEIRVERLQDISEGDCVKEGIIKDWYNGFSAAKPKFEFLWISINGADSWNSNPWVWVIAFERITDENEIAAIRKQWNERRAK